MVNFDDDASVPDQVYTMGKRIEPVTLPVARLGTGTLSYSIADLPPGLVFDDTSRTLYGTPTQAAEGTVTYKVTDDEEAEATLEFTITVMGPLTFSEAPTGFDFTVGEDIGTTDPLPEAAGGKGTRRYSASGVPAGLAFNDTDRTLSGTPSTPGTYQLLLEVTDEAGAGASLPVPVRVHRVPWFEAAAVNVSFPGRDVTLAEARGGFAPLTYSLACIARCTSLPSGLVFEADTRRLSSDFATPGRYTLKLTATDDNDAQGSQTIELLVADIVIKAYGSQADQESTTEVPIASRPIEIKVPEAPPAGLDFAAARRYTLQLSGEPNTGDWVEIELAGPSGDPDLQYFHGTRQTTTLDFRGNDFNSAKTVVLLAANDADGENGRATIHHKVTSNDEAYHGLEFDVHLVEDDDDPRIELSLDPATLAEGAGETEREITVTATVKPPAGRTSPNSFPDSTVITLSVAGGTARAGADYEVLSPFQITIPARSTESQTATFTLTPVQDEIYEGDETVIVSDTADPEGRTPASATLTIADDDDPPIYLSASCEDRIVEEGDDGQTKHFLCTVTRHDGNNNPVISSEDVDFNYATAGGTATAGEDYVEVKEGDGSGTIKAGQSSANVVLAVLDDTVEEVPETFNVVFSASPPFGTVTITIQDDDGGPAAQRISTTAGEEPTDEEGPTDPDDGYRATAAFGATAYSVTEGGPAATIAVTLDPAAPEARTIAIPISGKGGPGVTREDWRIAVNSGARDTWDAATGTAIVRFAAGETERTFTLEALDDDDFEGNEKLTLSFDASRLPDGVTADPAAAEAVVTLVDDDLQEHRGRVLKHVLAAFGRTVASAALTLLTGRMDDGPAGGASSVSLAGQSLRLGGALPGAPGADALAGAGPAERHAVVLADAHDPWTVPGAAREARAITVRELLTGSSFRHRLGVADGQGLAGGAWTLWGEGGAARFEGRPATDFSLDGDVASGWLGVDWQRKPAVMGISLSHYRGAVDYETTGAAASKGDVELDLTSVFPYARWSLESTELWGIAGVGTGRLELVDTFGGNRSDMAMQMAAAGARRTIRPAGERGISLAAKADGFVVRMESEARGLDTRAAGDDLPAVNARAGRLRVALEAGYRHTLASGAVLRPTADVGARLDSGDADSGAGVDVAGGLRYESPSGRLTLEGQGRVLLAHAADGFQEWAAGGLVRLAPETDGRGLFLSVAPSWGVATSRAGALWDADLPDTRSDPGARMTAEVGYGLPAFSGVGLLTPWAGTELAEGEGRTWRAGLRLELRRDLALSIEGSHRDKEEGEPEDAVGLRLSVHF